MAVAVQGEKRLQVASTVEEGGTVVVQAATGVNSVYFCVPGLGTVCVQVVGGVAEYQLPAGLASGTLIIVSDGKLPDPQSEIVTVVGTEAS